MIQFDKDGTSFTLSFKNRVILKHAPKDPCISIGRGDADYVMNHSSFKIKDKLHLKKPLKTWQAVQSGEDLIKLSFDDVLTVTIKLVDGRLEMGMNCSQEEYNRVWVNLPAEHDEAIYGCGEQFSVLNMRGRKFPIWVEEQGVGRGKDLITLLANLHSGSGGTWYTTYFAQPTFVSSANYYCHVEMSHYALFDFTRKTCHTLEMWQIPEKLVFDVAPSAVELLGSLSSYLGRQPELPQWTYEGIWLGVQGGSQEVKAKLDDALNAGVKVGALWAQDWEGIRMTSFGKQLMWNWKYDPGLYPDLPAYIQELNARGIRFLGYINPMLALEGDLYQEAVQKGYLVKSRDGGPAHVYITSFPAGLVDLTNPEAMAWYKNVIKKHMIGIGLSGWMADFGEALPPDAVLHSGESGEKIHNHYPALWARTNREAVEEAGKLGEVVFFTRSGFTGSSRHSTAFWAGDQNVNWSMDDGLATIIPAFISAGFLGIAYNHADIGGYTTLVWIKRTKELMLRWTELSAFTPIMRSHEGNRPEANWQFNSDAETLAHLARLSKIFVDLGPYHRYLAAQYTKTGIPPMRHPYLHYESDQSLHNLMYQYMYGPDLMIAPVYKPKRENWKVYLPDDKWIHLWSGKRHSEGWHVVPAPIGQPPVFFKADSNFRVLFESLRKF